MKDRFLCGSIVRFDDRLEENELGFTEPDGSIKIFVFDLESETVQHVRTILCNGVEVRRATDAEQASALEDAAASLGPPFSIRLMWGEPLRPCAMMPIGLGRNEPGGLSTLAGGRIDRAWTDETGCITLPRNSQMLRTMVAIHCGSDFLPIPFKIPEEGNLFTVNVGPNRPRGFAW